MTNIILPVYIIVLLLTGFIEAQTQPVDDNDDTNTFLIDFEKNSNAQLKPQPVFNNSFSMPKFDDQKINENMERKDSDVIEKFSIDEPDEVPFHAVVVSEDSAVLEGKAMDNFFILYVIRRIPYFGPSLVNGIILFGMMLMALTVNLAYFLFGVSFVQHSTLYNNGRS